MSVTVQEVQVSWIGGALGIHFDIYLQIDSCCYHQLSPPIPLSLLCSRRSIETPPFQSRTMSWSYAIFDDNFLAIHTSSKE